LNLLKLAAAVVAQLRTGPALMPNPGLCRIEYEASAFGVELVH